MGNEKTVRIGIIGCGGIANGKHMPSLRQIPGVQMVAFCDIIEERARKAKQDYGTPDAAVYTDYRKLLEDIQYRVRRMDYELTHSEKDIIEENEIETVQKKEQKKAQKPDGNGAAEMNMKNKRG